MPANEQTWRDQKFLHLVFGITSIIMLLATIWMMAKDHNREWKVYQRQFRNVEAYTANARLNEQESADYYAREKELKHKVDVARSEAPPADVVAAFVGEAQTVKDDNRYRYHLDRIESANEELQQAEAMARKPGANKAEDVVGEDGVYESARNNVIKKRDALVSAMQDVFSRAKQVEDNSQRDLKFKRAELDGVRSQYDIGVNEGMPESELAKIEQSVDNVAGQVESLLTTAQTAKQHREKLQKLLDQAVASETVARKTLADHEGDVNRLETALAERRNNVGKELLELPIIDAFGRPLKVDNIWLPQLTWNNNFRDVARFDRCTTCHQGIEKTAPGSAIEPGYPTTKRFGLNLETPAELPELTQEQERHLAEDIKDEKAKKEQELQYNLVNTYGLQLGEQGVFAANDVTITVVRPRSPAAKARLEPGDVIEQINDVKITERPKAIAYLLDSVDWGKPLTLHVRRGIPEPFNSHPRLDLFVGSMSPHKLGEMGCTACHDGQGSATEFKWVSHTPNTPAQAEEWHTKYGWFNNHNWLFPVMPKRFNESLCLKCHHDVVELEPSERFPDAPAPKLVEGFDTIRQFGCFGCHEINGWDGPTRRRGPDLRAEPVYFAAAQSVLTDAGLNDHERALAHEVIDNPERHEARKLLAEAIKADAALVPPTEKKPQQLTEKMGGEVAEQKAADAVDGDDETAPADHARLTAATHKLATILGADDETPGQYRKVGPSLRYVGSKVDLPFLYDWIRNPTNFRPNTKMPRFFGLWDHLVPEEEVDADGKRVMVESKGRKDAERFEPVEIRAIAEYLLDQSQPFEYIEPYQGVTQEASTERGKELFQTRGCLACHQHKEFPNAKQTQGPDLSRIGAKLKLKGEDGQRWLYSWVREPNHYHARTVMPNLFLEPITSKDEEVSDPAADIAAYLMSSQDDAWQPAAVPDVDTAALNDLAYVYLKASFTERQARKFAEQGIPAEFAADIKGDEQLMVRGEGDESDLTKQKLLYIGRRSISRLGCSGCHDIPGFEDAKPIGTGLADWGRKDTSKLAFEMVVEYLREHPPGHKHNRNHHAGDGEAEHGEHAEGGHHSLDPLAMDADTGFFVEALLHHQREGFIWQKLREPRSYDFKKTENKEYTDRLRMPKFNFDQNQIEAVMTFVLGLVAEPPAAKYIYKGTPRRKAIVEGEQLLVKYNCVGCHTVKMETWEFDYDPESEDFANGPAFDDYEFLRPHFTPQQLADSKKTDRRGMGHAQINGMPVPVTEDHEPDEPVYMTLWDSVAINGHAWPVSTQVPVMERDRTSVRPYLGGDFARLLHPVAMEIGRRDNPNVKESDVWGWVPPPLVREGQKVQTGWLHDFLLNPYPIRPAALLRMPRFNMSSEEAEKLVHYFAAADNVDYPYQYHRSGGSDYVSDSEVETYDQALKLVTDNNYCVKCHLVGDFRPKGLAAALAPNLDRIYQRLRPGYLVEWLAHPTYKLPYTGMPVNFPPHNDPNAKIRTSLFPGESEDALRGVVSLLLNYDTYMKRHTDIKSMVKEPPPADAAGQSASLDK